MKLGIDSADPQNRGRLVKQAQPSIDENRAIKWIYDDDECALCCIKVYLLPLCPMIKPYQSNQTSAVYYAFFLLANKIITDGFSSVE